MIRASPDISQHKTGHGSETTFFLLRRRTGKVMMQLTYSSFYSPIYHLRPPNRLDRHLHKIANSITRTYNNSTFQHLGKSLFDGACTDSGTAIAISVSAVSVRSSHLVFAVITDIKMKDRVCVFATRAVYLCDRLFV